MAKSFAVLLREYRGDRSQAKVSEILDISPAYYSELERGKKEPSYRILIQIVERSGRGLAYWLDAEALSAPEDAARLSSGTASDEKMRPLTVPEITTMLGRVWYSIDSAYAFSGADREIIADMLDACRRSLDRSGKENI